MIGLFHLTHTAQVDFGGVSWQRIALPDAGAVSDQNAWLMTALDHLRDEYNAMTHEALQDTKKKRTSSGE